jgi:hypothetical protein
LQSAVTGAYTASAVVARVPSTQHLRVAPERLHVLVEVDWPGGKRRYSDAPVAVGSRGYGGRLLSLSPIVKGTTGRQSTTTVALDNLCVFRDSVESLWTDADPPENSEVRAYYWFEDDGPLQAIELFRGVVEEIQSLSENSMSFSAASTEGMDRFIGTEIDTTAFPDAPEESVGKIQPLLFGGLVGFQPIPTTRIGSSATSTITLKDAVAIDLEDASRFPVSGTVLIQDERIDYTGKSGNQLTGCTRGASSTIATGYAEGIPVVEVGEAQYLVAAHAVSSISDVYALTGDRKRFIPASEYTLDLTGPSTITFPTGIPTLPVPAGGSSFMEIQFDSAAPQCTAENPTFACADHPDWNAKNAAKLEATAGKRDLIIQQDDEPEPVGDILQTWLAVEFDNRAFPLGGGGTIDISSQGIPLGDIDDANGNIESEIMNRVGVGLIRGYNDQHNHVVTTSASSSSTTQTDDKEGTAASIRGWATDIGNVTNGSDANFAQNDDTSGDASFQVSGFSFPANTTSFKIVCITEGGASHKGSFHLRFYKPGLTANPHGIVVKDLFVQPISLQKTFRSSDITFQSAHSGGKLVVEETAGRSRCDRLYLEVTSVNTSTISAHSTSFDEEPLVHTRLYLFDTTAQLSDWGQFKGATAQASFASGTGGDTFDIVKMSYIVKYAEKTIQNADRLLCNVTGLAPGGRPSDVIEAVITDSSMLAAKEGPFTNLIVQSNSFGNTAAWGAFSGGTVSQDVSTPFDNGWTLNDTSTSFAAIARGEGDLPTADQPYTLSMFVREGTASSSIIGLTPSGGTTPPSTQILLLLKFIGGVARVTLNAFSSLIPLPTIHSNIDAGDGWYRIAVTFPKEYITDHPRFTVGVYPAGTVASATGSLLVYGPQLEVGEVVNGSLTFDATILDGDIGYIGHTTTTALSKESPDLYNKADLAAIRTSHDAINYKLGFSVERKTRALDLIKRISWQSRLLWFEEFGQLCFRYQDDLASLPTASITYRADDIVIGSFRRSRTTLRDVTTRLSATYNYSWEFGRLDSLVAENVPSSALYERNIGVRPADYQYDLLRNESNATNLRDFMIERFGQPRWRVTWKTFLPGLEVRRGDIVAIDLADVSYSQVEVVEIRIAGVEVEFTGIVWDSL